MIDAQAVAGRVVANVEKVTLLIKQLPDEKLQEDFVDKKYGSYYRNIHGIIEHTHYHLGQIGMLKKIIQK